MGHFHSFYCFNFFAGINKASGKCTSLAVILFSLAAYSVSLFLSLTTVTIEADITKRATRQRIRYPTKE